MNNEVEIKQKYLYENIIKENYDADKFIKFIDNLKENGKDINNWSYEELKEVVKQFIDSSNMNNNIKKKLEKGNINESLVINNNQTEVIENINKIEKKKNIEEELNEMGYIKMNNNKLFFTELFLKNKIKVKFLNHDYIKGGIFSSSYIEYNIEINPMNWKIKRRYNHFLLFYKVISKNYPFIYIPPIPPKSFKEKNNNNLINKRIKIFISFFEEILEIPELRNSEELFIFLSYDNLKELDIQLNNLLKTRMPSIECLDKTINKDPLIIDTIIENLNDLDSNLKYNVSNEMLSSIDNIKKFCKEEELLENKMKTIMKEIKSSLNKLLTDFNFYSNTYKELISIRNMYFKDDISNKILLNSENIYKNYEKKIKNEINSIKNNIKFNLNYSILSYECFNNLIKKRDLFQEKFENYSWNQYNKFQKCADEKEIKNKYKLELKNILNFKKILGYFNVKIYSSFNDFYWRKQKESIFTKIHFLTNHLESSTLFCQEVSELNSFFNKEFVKFKTLDEKKVIYLNKNNNNKLIDKESNQFNVVNGV